MPSDLRKLAKLPSLVDGAYAHLGAIPRDPHKVEILEQMWPECHTSEFTGTVIMAPSDVERLEALYRMFGVPLLVKDNSLQVLGHAYDVFGLSLSTFVSHKLMFPEKFGQCKSFREYLGDWPDKWVQYIEAVASADFKEARRLAQELQVLAPGCEYPADIHVNGPCPPPN